MQCNSKNNFCVDKEIFQKTLKAILEKNADEIKIISLTKTSTPQQHQHLLLFLCCHEIFLLRKKPMEQ